MLSIDEAKDQILRRAKVPRMWVTNRGEFVTMIATIVEMTGHKDNNIYYSGMVQNGNVISGHSDPLDDEWARAYAASVIEIISKIKI